MFKYFSFCSSLGSAASLVEELAENQVYVKVVVYYPESKKNEVPTRDEEREDHDGTPTSAATESPASNDHRHIIVN